MSDNEKVTQTVEETTSGRRGFLYAVIGGILAALTGCIAGTPPGEERLGDEDSTAGPFETRLSVLEAKVAQLEEQLSAATSIQPLAQLEGEMNERVVFNKSELTVTNPEGVLLNLVTNGASLR